MFVSPSGLWDDGASTSTARSTPPRSSVLNDLTNCMGDHQRINRTASTIQTVEHWQAIISACLEHHVALDGPMLVRLNTLMGEVIGLIRRLGEANLDLCVFCRNNNETFEMYTSHKVKDRTGRVTCPILRRFVCPLCSATGDRAHTIRYCPLSVQSGRLPIQGVSTNPAATMGSLDSIISQLSGMSLRL
ncbi:hypothetical protein AAHC03_0725 [Spirometra sp. Aus1]|nr:unnamed protein product [Spirometra erinaceieuropaei]